MYQTSAVQTCTNSYFELHVVWNDARQHDGTARLKQFFESLGFDRFTVTVTGKNGLQLIV